jgi:hypothetical protein
MNVATLLVRSGEDERLPIDRKTGRSQHTNRNVYREMLLTICSEYSCLPDPRTLSMTEIRFFYNGVRAELKRRSKPKSSKKR